MSTDPRLERNLHLFHELAERGEHPLQLARARVTEDALANSADYPDVLKEATQVFDDVAEQLTAAGEKVPDISVLDPTERLALLSCYSGGLQLAYERGQEDPQDGTMILGSLSLSMMAFYDDPVLAGFILMATMWMLIHDDEEQGIHIRGDVYAPVEQFVDWFQTTMAIIMMDYQIEQPGLVERVRAELERDGYLR